MKLLTVLALVTLLAGCASPAPMTKEAPQSTERSDRAHQELDKEMNK